jgi:hypothetical protein
MVHAYFLANIQGHGNELRVLNDSLLQKCPNRIARLAPEGLVAGAVEAGLAVCNDLAIREWRHFDSNGPECPPPGTRELGTAILLEAWRTRSRTSEAEYVDWERKFIYEMAAELA